MSNNYEIDKETARELIEFMKCQYIPHEYLKVHEFFLKLWKFIENDGDNR